MQRRWPAVLTVATMLCACAQPVDGVAVAGFPGVTEQFEPCSIPDDAIVATGLDLEKTEVGWGEGISVREWTRCTWSGPAGDAWYYFSILFSLQYSLDDARRNPNYLNIEDVDIGSRKAIRFRFNGVDQGDGCDAAIDTNEGLVRISVYAMGGLTPHSDPCPILLRHAADLESYLPAPA
ncbi:MULTISPECIES: DUF3558 domain-containing protein [unclassified Rhodococcus (in: high G+C Gram-positive bacteria)]|uniref:DUF3558 domain-containing protein n=1 Tax=unclassified Rhodococcus (in: high G+C Gram-positive bacteria) TaxID=192944 RepID=UPI0033996695